MNQQLLRSAILSGMVLCLAGTAWAQDPLGSNPPVFQSIGMLDALPHSFTEADCRQCHDNGVPDRHHVLYDQPIIPGSIVPFPDSDGDGSPDVIYDCLNCHDPNLTVVRDCMACHNAGSPHHTTQAAFDRHCTYCHGDMVDDYDDGHYIPAYSASLVTPHRGRDGDGYENAPWPTPDLASDGSGRVVPADVTTTTQGPPFFTVTNIGGIGTMHTRTEPNDLSFKPAGFNNDFVIASTHFGGETFNVEFGVGILLSASWDGLTQTLSVILEPTQSAADVVNAINAATGGVDVDAVLGFDGDDPVAGLLPDDHYESPGGAPANSRGYGAGSCSYCHDIDGALDANGQPDGLIWDNRTLHHDIGLPSVLNDGAGGTMPWCDACHYRPTVGEQSGPSFNLAIRTCEWCHGPDSLHNIQADSPNPSNLGLLVIGGEDAGYGHVGRDGGAGDSDCWGCHAFATESAAVFDRGPVIPTLRASELPVVHAGQDTTVFLHGAGFTNEADGITYESDVRLTAEDGSWVILAPELVDQSLMSVTIPGDTAPGNHRLQAVKDKFASNPIVLTVNPEVIITEVTTDRGHVTIHGSGFGGYGASPGTSVTARVAGARGKGKTTMTVEGDIVSWNSTTIVADFRAMPKEVTIHSVYGTATFEVRGRGKPPKKPRE